MRIVAGRFKGRALVAPSGMATRPTSDRLRETLFNVLLHAYDDPVTDARVLDLAGYSSSAALDALKAKLLGPHTFGFLRHGALEAEQIGEPAGSDHYPVTVRIAVPAATDAPPPMVEPPGKRFGSHGLRVGP